MMTAPERAATEAFHSDLLGQFRDNAAVMWAAHAAGDEARYAECVEETRRLYRELREVEFCLTNNVLPPDVEEVSRNVA